MTAARRAGNQVQCGRTVEQAGTAELARSEEGRSPFVSAGDGCGDLERERERNVARETVNISPRAVFHCETYRRGYFLRKTYC